MAEEGQQEAITETVPGKPGTTAMPEAEPTVKKTIAKETTLATEAEGEEETQPTPANWPANWRELLAGEDKKFLGRLKRFDAPTQFAKSWLAAQQKISSGETVKEKPTDEQELKKWRAEAGLPETPDGYLANIPDGLVIGEEDKPLVETFLQDMHEADAKPALVHKALQWYYHNQEKLLEQRAELDRANRAKAEDVLRADWGSDYRPNLNSIDGLFTTHAPEGLLEAFFSARLADGTPLGDHPDTLRFLSALAREINPHGTITPIAGQSAIETIKTEKAALEEEMKDNKSNYWVNPSKQARWRELYELEQRYTRKAG